MKNYKAIGKIGEGTFSEVMKMQSLRDGNFYACKQMKQRFESIEQVNNLREIQALRRLNPHPNILTLHEVVLNGIFHRDVKPENILIKQDVLKLGDFGSCRSAYSKQPYTEYISTRWYRAPECLLTDGFYSHKMDLWSAGCVFYEISSLQPLFPGTNELDQISRIHEVLGTPTEKTLSKFKQSRAMSFDFPFKKGSGIPLVTDGLSPHCLSLLHAMVAYDPDDRVTAHQALQHPYFQEQRTAVKLALASHRKAFFAERPLAPALLYSDSQPLQPKESGQSVDRVSSFCSPALPSVLGPGAGSRVAVLRPLECVGASQKLTPKDLKAGLRQWRLPAIERKGGGH